MNHKRYWMKGGIFGLIIGFLIISYFFSTSACFGAYMNFDGSIVSNCPTGLNLFILNAISLPLYGYLVFIGVPWFAGVIIGLIYGKIKNRKIIISKN